MLRQVSNDEKQVNKYRERLRRTNKTCKFDNIREKNHIKGK